MGSRPRLLLFFSTSELLAGWSGVGQKGAARGLQQKRTGGRLEREDQILDWIELTGRLSPGFLIARPTFGQARSAIGRSL